MPYRIEVSPNKRAGCKDKHCKDAGVKIEKGEIRFGSWVQIPQIDKGSFSWKHWGCITPKQVENLKAEIEGDVEMLDGYEELPDEWQQKVRRALDQGHVDDEDWKHDMELNRPGQAGTKKKTPKKKTEAEENGDEADSPTKAAPKKRGRAKKADEEVEEDDEAPAAKRGKGAANKATKAAPDAAADKQPAAKKPRAPRAKKAKATDEDVQADEETKPAPKRSARAKKAAPAVVEDDSDEGVAEESKAKAAPKKGGRKKKAAKVDDNDE